MVQAIDALNNFVREEMPRKRYKPSLGDRIILALLRAKKGETKSIQKAAGAAAFPARLMRLRKKTPKARPRGQISRTRAEEISATRLSRPSQKQLGWLSESDYEEVMGILKGKKSK